MPVETLSIQNIAFIKFVSSLLDYKGEFQYSSNLPSNKLRSDRVEELLRWCDAKTYFCAKGSYDYMLEDGIFPLLDISVCFQDYYIEPYPQIGSKNEFIPYLSILDALMNIGPDRTREYVVNGTKKWIVWDEMKSKILNEQIC